MKKAKSGKDNPHLREDVINALKKCYDPEVNIDVWNLGLIYNIDINGKGIVGITMTLTTPTCPLGPMIIEQVRESVSQVKNVSDVRIKLVFSPLWTPERMSDEARDRLRY